MINKNEVWYNLYNNGVKTRRLSMDNLQLQEVASDLIVSQKMSYEEFLKLEKTYENRYEYIDGYVYPRASTSTYHSFIKREVWKAILMYLMGKDSVCEVFDELRLLHAIKEEDKNKDCIADLAIVCDKDKFMGGKYHGIPTLIVEIVSPGNSSVDFIKKRNAYMELGVEEYWIIDSRIGEVENVVAYKVMPGEEDTIYEREDTINSSVFEGLSVDLKYIYDKVKDLV